MKLLTLSGFNNITLQHRVLLFGSGLIGNAIETSLCSRSTNIVENILWPWLDDIKRCNMATAVERRLGERKAEAISIVWAAGRSGMGSDRLQMQQESFLFQEVLALAQRLVKKAVIDVHIHLVSSAGGLFEGCRYVDKETMPSPARFYGVGKLHQEALLMAACSLDRKLHAHIYRPSTVYGFRTGARMGLMSVLVLNGLFGRTSVIAGRHDTIRDYVSTDDIGQFIAAKVADAFNEDPKPILLVSGRPAPIGEIVAEIEQFMGKRLLLRYDPRPTNSENMSYRQSAVPVDFAITDLRTGIRQLAMKVKAHVFRASQR